MQNPVAASDLQPSFAQSFFQECFTFFQKISAKFSFTKKYFLFILLAFLCGAESLSAAELPTGGVVEAGQAVITQSAHTLNVDQSSQRAVVSWQSFDVARGNTVNFNQPNANTSTLNRVNSASRSMIDGAINAKGQVIFVNPNGVVFGRGAEVNVGGLVATTMNTSNNEFMNANDSMTFEGSESGKVVNKGIISINDVKGYVALMAPEVKNEGVILATLSGQNSVALVSGQKVTLTFADRQLIYVSVDASVINSLINNKRLIQTNGGQVVIAANSANDLRSSVINNTGTVIADGVSVKGGVVTLTAATINQSGTISANSASASGGNITMAAKEINLSGNSKTTAIGVQSGGQLNINAVSTVNVNAGAIVNASATQNGQGGSIAINAPTVNLNGKLIAQGGAQSGNGGSITTTASALHVDNNLVIDASASNGQTGSWTINMPEINFNQNLANVISATLNTTNVVINTFKNLNFALANTVTNLSGNINYAKNVVLEKTSNILTSLTINAEGVLNIGGEFNNTSSAPLDMVLMSSDSIILTSSAQLNARFMKLSAPIISVDGSLNAYGSSNSESPFMALLGGRLAISGTLRSGSKQNKGAIQIQGDNVVDINGAHLIAANDEFGGDISIASNGDININNTTILTNGSNGRGGSLNIDATNVSIFNSTLEANGTNGGGLVSVVANSGDVNFQQSFIQTNGGAGVGGSILISGVNNTIILSTKMDSTGYTQGGTIKIGNDATDQNIPFSNFTFIDSDSVLNANQLNLDSNHNGGYIETSGHILSMLATINAGRGGIWLLDPTDIVISSGSNYLLATSNALPNSFSTCTGSIYCSKVPFVSGTVYTPSSSTASVININSLIQALNLGQSITITTVGSAGAGKGDITVNSVINATDGSLSLQAAGNVYINQSITLSGPTSELYVAAGVITDGLASPCSTCVIRMQSNITTTSHQRYNGPVEIATYVTLTSQGGSSSDGYIIFGSSSTSSRSTINDSCTNGGCNRLTILTNYPGSVTFWGDIGATRPLYQIQIDGNSLFTNGLIKTTSTQYYNVATINLAGDTTMQTTQNQPIQIYSTIDDICALSGCSSLTLNAGTSNIILNGVIGAQNAIKNLTLKSKVALSLDITTIGDQIYEQAVTISNALRLQSSSLISFKSTLDDYALGASDLIVKAGGIGLTGNVGSTYAFKTIKFDGAVQLFGDITVKTYNGAITFTSTIDSCPVATNCLGNPQDLLYSVHSLVLNSGSATTTINDSIGYNNPLGAIEFVSPIIFGVTETSPTSVLAGTSTFIAGQTYQILTAGNTPWTMVGASSNAVGTIFTASLSPLAPNQKSLLDNFTGTGVAFVISPSYSSTQDKSYCPSGACFYIASRNSTITFNASANDAANIIERHNLILSAFNSSLISNNASLNIFASLGSTNPFASINFYGATNLASSIKSAGDQIYHNDVLLLDATNITTITGNINFMGSVTGNGSEVAPQNLIQFLGAGRYIFNATTYTANNVAFSNSQTANVTYSSTTKSYQWTPSATDIYKALVVGGGGAGGQGGGGGGAGGIINNARISIVAGTAYTIVVGDGGIYSRTLSLANGGNSQFGSLIALGGGSGWYCCSPGNSGGSGGGASTNTWSTPGGTGTYGQGFAGGSSSLVWTYNQNNNFQCCYAYWQGGGGGGAGGSPVVQPTATYPGGTGNNNPWGQPGVVSTNATGLGGIGLLSNITGANAYYGGGGGGGVDGGQIASNTWAPMTSGGKGGGGNGAYYSGANPASGVPSYTWMQATNGQANTGGGGGGTYWCCGTPGSGGSGLVIIAKPTYGVAVDLTINSGGKIYGLTTLSGAANVTNIKNFSVSSSGWGSGVTLNLPLSMITSTTSFTKGGSDYYTIDGLGSYTHPLTINGGKLFLTNSPSNNLSIDTLTLNGGALVLDQANPQNLIVNSLSAYTNSPITNANTVRVNGEASLGSSISSVGDQYFAKDVTLWNDTTLTSANGNVVFGGNIYGYVSTVEFLGQGQYIFLDAKGNPTTGTVSSLANLPGGFTLSYLNNQYTFTSSFNSQGRVLIVGGGGGGGQGGGGGGGVVQTNVTLNAFQSYNVSVGAGGLTTVDQNGNNPGVNGGKNGDNSTFNTFVAYGGGGGGGVYTLMGTNAYNCPCWNDGYAGGSGGGASYNEWQLGGAGVLGQGYAGGQSTIPNGYSWLAGGGGGAGGSPINVGGNYPSTAQTGNGGIGIQSNITGSYIYYGGGGGGSNNTYNSTQPSGGLGGGGKGSYINAGQWQQPTAGAANTGGGGGGGWWCCSGASSMSGGSGIVVLNIGIAPNLTITTQPSQAYPDVFKNTNFSRIGVLTINTAGNFTLDAAGQIASSAGIVKQGAGVLTLNNISSYAGSVSVAGGTVRTPGLTGALTMGSLDLANGGTFDLVSSGGQDLNLGSFNISNGGSLLHVNNLNVSGSATLSGTISTAQTQNYNGAVKITSDVIIQTANNSAITFASTIDGISNGDFNLQFYSSASPLGSVTLSGIVGGIHPLKSILANSPSSLGSAINTIGDQTYNGNVTLVGDTTLNSYAGNIQINGNVTANAYYPGVISLLGNGLYGYQTLGIGNTTSYQTYLATGTANATAIVVGQQYQILTAGNTSWTSFGASSNTIGTLFTATVSGTASSGTGTATSRGSQAPGVVVSYNATTDLYSWTANYTSNIKALLVAGGGAGGLGGGGGGGVLYNSQLSVVSNTAYAINVGKGGLTYSNSYYSGGNGANSNFGSFTGTADATAIVVGQQYQILTAGNTSWTSLGASSNTVGTTFTAAISGTASAGTGTATTWSANTFSAIGGGGGASMVNAQGNCNNGCWVTTASSGGSGGGSSIDWNKVGGSGTGGQGNSGAGSTLVWTYNQNNNFQCCYAYWQAGGGGGAGGSPATQATATYPGQSNNPWGQTTVVSTNTSGQGGIGLSNNITGTAVYYGAGGGGGLDGGQIGPNSWPTGTSGGLGGGGNGAYYTGNTWMNGTNGQANTGGGGGGGYWCCNQAGAGGSGIVILSVPVPGGKASLYLKTKNGSATLTGNLTNINEFGVTSNAPTPMSLNFSQVSNSLGLIKNGTSQLTINNATSYNGYVSLLGGRLNLVGNNVSNVAINNLIVANTSNLSISQSAGFVVNGTASLGGDVTTNNFQTYKGVVTLTSNVVLTSPTYVKFESAVNDANFDSNNLGMDSLRINGPLTSLGSIGALNNLNQGIASISVSGNSVLSGSVITSGAQTFSDIQLTGNLLLKNFSSTLSFGNFTQTTASLLTLDSPTDKTFNFNQISPISGFTKSNLNAVTINQFGNYSAGSILVNAGTLNINASGSSIQVFNFGEGIVSGTTVNLVSGSAVNLTVGGTFTLGLNSYLNNLNNLIISGNAILRSDLSTLGDQQYNSTHATQSVRVGSKIVLTSVNGNINFAGGLAEYSDQTNYLKLLGNGSYVYSIGGVETSGAVSSSPVAISALNMAISYANGNYSVINSTLNPVSLLIVGGGGAGGIGGGGGGGVNNTSTLLLPNTVYLASIGQGGVTTVDQSGNNPGIDGGGNGSNSQFGNIIAYGGGGGGGVYQLVGTNYYATPSGNWYPGNAGGSGGGGATNNWNIKGGAGVVGQGNAGGVSTYVYRAPWCQNGCYVYWQAGGGGGAGGSPTYTPVPGNPFGQVTAVTSNSGGQGGIGYYSNITGNPVYYGGGGGGGIEGNGAPIGSGIYASATLGGLGGGGNGAYYNGSWRAPTAGLANTGGGGGGSMWCCATQNASTMSGGSGVIIVRQLSDLTINVGLSGSSGRFNAGAGASFAIGALTINSNNNFTLTSNQIAQATIFTKGGAGIFTLNDFNTTFAKNISMIVNGGTVVANHGAATSLSMNSLTINNGSIFDLSQPTLVDLNINSLFMSSSSNLLGLKSLLVNQLATLGGSITTPGIQTYNGQIKLAGDTNLRTQGSGNGITINATVDDLSLGLSKLTLTVDDLMSARATLNGAIGSILSIQSLTINGLATIGTSISTTGNQTYNNDLTLTNTLSALNNVSMTTQTGDVNFNGNVTGYRNTVIQFLGDGNYSLNGASYNTVTNPATGISLSYSSTSKAYLWNNVDSNTVQLLLVGGGGAGGVNGGGGGGGVISDANFVLTNGTNYTITIGAGGLTTVDQNGNNPGVDGGLNGGSSTFASYTAYGGGGGGGVYTLVGTNYYAGPMWTPGYNGASGGGGSWNYGTPSATNITYNQQGAAIYGSQGYAGAPGTNVYRAPWCVNGCYQYWQGGGGGGAGGAATYTPTSGNPWNNIYYTTNPSGGNGGPGRMSTISGTTQYYGGGGGGASDSGQNGPSSWAQGGLGGIGGGGTGGYYNGSQWAQPTAGTANSGGGGGGGYWCCATASNMSGGSGVVILNGTIASFSRANLTITTGDTTHTGGSINFAANKTLVNIGALSLSTNRTDQGLRTGLVTNTNTTSLVKNGSGTIAIDGLINYAHTIEVDGGTLSLTNSVSNSLSIDTLILHGGNLQLDSNNPQDLTVNNLTTYPNSNISYANSLTVNTQAYLGSTIQTVNNMHFVPNVILWADTTLTSNNGDVIFDGDVIGFSATMQFLGNGQYIYNGNSTKTASGALDLGGGLSLGYSNNQYTFGTQFIGSASVLVVGGGGAGGLGGGGGGGVILSDTTLNAGAFYTVIVGNGGTSYSNTYRSGGNGQSSQFGSNFIAVGGGGGGGYQDNQGVNCCWQAGSAGGSGGGASTNNWNIAGGKGTGGQGNNGAASTLVWTYNQNNNFQCCYAYWQGGGGGGAGGSPATQATATYPGGTGNNNPWGQPTVVSTNATGQGGIGRYLINPSTNAYAYFGGGGGGGVDGGQIASNTWAPGTSGGSGGGGNGSYYSGPNSTVYGVPNNIWVTATNGLANTGGGGGGGYWCCNQAGAGGSGIVSLKIQNTPNLTLNLLGSSNTNPLGASKGTANATAIVAGQQYKILTAGTTSWTSFGASSNAVDTFFTATISGTTSSGTGTATSWTAYKSLGTLTVNTNANWTIDTNRLSSTLGFVKGGGGSLNLTNPSNYAGFIGVSNGTLYASDSSNTVRLSYVEVTGGFFDLMSDGNLVVNGLTITDAGGLMRHVVNMTVNGSAQIGGTITTIGSQTYNGPVSITSDTTILSTNISPISFNSSINSSNGAHSLAIYGPNTTSGVATINGQVGAINRLTSLTINSPSSLGGSINTILDQTYFGNVTLIDHTSLDSVSGNVYVYGNVTGDRAYGTPLAFLGNGQYSYQGVNYVAGSGTQPTLPIAITISYNATTGLYSWTAPYSASFDALLVGGGGAGGLGGGGGGGVLYQQQLSVISQQIYNILVGAGGLAYGNSSWSGGNGGNSSVGSFNATANATSIVVGQKYQILNAGTTSWTSIGASSNTVGTVFTATSSGTGTGTATTWSLNSLSAIGGGGGASLYNAQGNCNNGCWVTQASSGGSGGGSSIDWNKLGGTGTIGQGNSGGGSTYVWNLVNGSNYGYWQAGGGGGAGGSTAAIVTAKYSGQTCATCNPWGQTTVVSTNATGQGGIGLANSITGTSVYYGGGGGGGIDGGQVAPNTWAPGTYGGLGGGGNGTYYTGPNPAYGLSSYTWIQATNGTANTGGGGGGGLYGWNKSGDGGSGVVILNVPVGHGVADLSVNSGTGQYFITGSLNHIGVLSVASNNTSPTPINVNPGTVWARQNGVTTVTIAGSYLSDVQGFTKGGINDVVINNLRSSFGSVTVNQGNLYMPGDSSANNGQFTFNNLSIAQGTHLYLSNIKDLTVTGTSYLGNNLDITGSQNQTYTGAMTLGTDITLNATKTISFNSTIDSKVGTYGLSVTAPLGTVFKGNVGASKTLNYLTVDSVTTQLPANVTTIGDQIYKAKVTLNPLDGRYQTTLNATGLNSNIYLLGSVDAATAKAISLTMTASNNIYIMGNIGQTKQINAFVVNAKNIYLFADIYSGMTQTYNGDVWIGDGSNIASTIGLTLSAGVTGVSSSFLSTLYYSSFNYNNTGYTSSGPQHSYVRSLGSQYVRTLISSDPTITFNGKLNDYNATATHTLLIGAIAYNWWDSSHGNTYINNVGWMPTININQGAGDINQLASINAQTMVLNQYNSFGYINFNNKKIFTAYDQTFRTYDMKTQATNYTPISEQGTYTVIQNIGVYNARNFGITNGSTPTAIRITVRTPPSIDTPTSTTTVNVNGSPVTQTFSGNSNTGFKAQSSSTSGNTSTGVVTGNNGNNQGGNNSGGNNTAGGGSSSGSGSGSGSGSSGGSALPPVKVVVANTAAPVQNGSTLGAISLGAIMQTLKGNTPDKSLPSIAGQRLPLGVAVVDVGGILADDPTLALDDGRKKK